MTIAVTAFGDLESRAPVLRSGARRGDVVAVSGALGLASQGLRLLFQHGTVDGHPDAAAAARLAAEHPAAIAAQLRPHPPIADGRAAALAGATSMLDLSDGLAIDARRIAVASGLAIDLRGRDVGGDTSSASSSALTGGEDHSLLATCPPGTVLPGGFRVIGAVVMGEGLLVDGVPFVERGGWDPYASGDGATGWDGQTY